jgi:hypothetical protein
MCFWYFCTTRVAYPAFRSHDLFDRFNLQSLLYTQSACGLGFSVQSPIKGFILNRNPAALLHEPGSCRCI